MQRMWEKGKEDGQMPRGKVNVERVIGGVGWVVVILAGIVISSWSLYSLARIGKIPVGIAVLTGATYDGLAFVSSVQAMAWNRMPNGYGVGARLAMMCAAGLSAYLNYQHGVITGVPVAVAYMLGSAPLAGLWALENHVRFLHRGNSRKQPLAKPELLVWVLFPGQAVRLVRASVEARLDEMREVGSVEGSNEMMRVWLKINGFKVGDTGPVSAEHRRIYAKAMKGNGDN